MGREDHHKENGEDVEMDLNPLKKPTLPLSQSLLDLFWNLAELNQSKQIEATTKLIVELHKESGDGRFSQKAEQAAGEVTQDSSQVRSLEYTLARLVRGLGSNRKGVRWGFGAALTVLLQEFPGLKTSKVLLEMEQSLKITGSQDMKTMAVGQLTVMMALVNSGRLQTINGAHLRTILDVLLRLEKEKSYLRAAVHEILNQIVQKVPGESFERWVLPQLKGHLGRKVSETDLDGLLLLLHAAQSHKDAMKSVFRQSLGTADLLDQKNVPGICQLLFTTSTRFLHPAVVAFAKAFQARPAIFPLFWSHFIDLSVAESTPWKAKIPFDVAPSLLKSTAGGMTDSQQIVAVASSKFLNALLRNAVTDRKNETEGLKAIHDSASKAVIQVQEALKMTRDQDCINKVLTGLLADQSALYNKAWSTFVSTLLYRVDATLAAKASEKLVTLVQSGSQESTKHLMAVLENVLKDKVKTAQDVQKFAKLIAFFGAEVFNASPNDAASISSKALMKFLSASSVEQSSRKSALLNMEDVEKEVAMKLAVMKALASCSVPTDALDHHQEGDGASAGRKGRKSQESSDKSASLTRQLSKLKLGGEMKAAVELLVMTVSALWLKVKPVLAEEVLKEVGSLVKDLAKLGDSLTDQQAAGQVLTLLLSLLALERPMFGTVELLFKALCPFLQEDAINGLSALVEAEDEEEEEGDETMEFDSEEEDEDEWSDVEEDEEVTVNGQELAQQKAALAVLPGIGKMPLNGHEEVESEADLDDDAMFQLDEVLSSMMRGRKNEKAGGGTTVAEADVQLRALRLLTSWVAYGPADDVLVLRLVAILTKLACHQRGQPSQRPKQTLLADACGKIIHLTKYRRKMDADKVGQRTTVEEVMGQMSQMIDDSSKVHSLKLHQQCSQALLFAQRILLTLLSTTVTPLEAASLLRSFYTPKLQAFAAKRSCTFGHILWNNLLTSSTQVGVALLPAINDMILSDELVLKRKGEELEVGEEENEEEGQVKAVDDGAGTLSRKYLPIRQVQLCLVAKNVLRTLGPTSMSHPESDALFTSTGQALLATLKRTLDQQGPLRVKKLLEEVCDYARFLLLWHRKQDKTPGAATSLTPIEQLWDMPELARLLDALVDKKLNTKSAKATKKTLITLRQALQGPVKKRQQEPAQTSSTTTSEATPPKRSHKKMKTATENGMDIAEE